MRNMTAVGVESENYFLATAFKAPKAVGLETFSSALERVGDQLWRQIRDNQFRAAISDELAAINAKWRQGGVFASHEEYTTAFRAAQDKGNPIYIAATILQNEVLAKYGGYTFNYALEAGKHSREIQGWIKKLRDAGWVEKMEADNQTILDFLRNMWE